MAKGVQFGRKAKLTPYQIAEATGRRAAGETATSIAKSFNINCMTIMRSVADCKARLFGSGKTSTLAGTRSLLGCCLTRVRIEDPDFALRVS
jgi:hypothetical protein